MPGRAVGGAVVVTVALGVLGACGGGGSVSGPADVIASAGTTTSAMTARVRTTTIGIEAARERPVSLYSTGLVDFAGGDSSAVMASDGGGDPATIETRQVGGRSYLRFNRRGAWIPSDSVADARDYPPALARLAGAGALGAGSTPDPARWLGILDDLAGVRDEGPERIDGVDTTRYGARFEGRNDLDVWIDGAGLVRRLVVALPARSGSVLIRTDLSDFGVPVRVTAPSPSEVLNLSPVPLPEGT